MSNVVPIDHLTRNAGRSRRSRRARVVRGRSESLRDFSKRGLAESARDLADVDVDAHRPQTRGDCAKGPRPCPYVSCAHHLYLDVNDDTGTIKLNFPDVAPEDMDHSCSLDITDEGATTLEGVADLMNITRERVRQVEAKILERLRGDETLGEFTEERGDGYGAGIFEQSRATLKSSSANAVEAEEEADAEAPLRVSFFDQAEESAAVFGERMVAGEMHFTSKVEAAICDRVADIYERRLIERALVVPKGTARQQSDAKRWGDHEHNKQRSFRPVEADRPEVKAMDSVEKVASAFQAMREKLGRIPTPEEVRDELGGSLSAASVAVYLSNARARGFDIPKRPSGPKGVRLASVESIDAAPASQAEEAASSLASSAEPSGWRDGVGRLNMWNEALRAAVKEADEDIRAEGGRGYPSVTREIARRVGLHSSPAHERSDLCYIGKIRSALQYERHRRVREEDEGELDPGDTADAFAAVDEEIETELVALKLAIAEVETAKAKVFAICKRIAGGT